MAHKILNNEFSISSLQTTELLHESLLRVITAADVNCHDRRHFLNLVGQVMRQVIITEHRKQSAAKRGAGIPESSLSTASNVASPASISTLDSLDLERIAAAVEELGSHDMTLATVVDLRFFSSLSFGQIANLLDVPKSRVFRDWTFAKAWLIRHLQEFEV